MFKVGEIAILQNSDYFTEYNGVECEILKGLNVHKIQHMDMMKKSHRLSYFAQMADGMRLNAAPHQLRKKPLPDESKSTRLELERTI